MKTKKFLLPLSLLMLSSCGKSVFTYGEMNIEYYKQYHQELAVTIDYGVYDDYKVILVSKDNPSGGTVAGTRIVKKEVDGVIFAFHKEFDVLCFDHTTYVSLFEESSPYKEGKLSKKSLDSIYDVHIEYVSHYEIFEYLYPELNK